MTYPELLAKSARGEKVPRAELIKTIESCGYKDRDGYGKWWSHLGPACEYPPCWRIYPKKAVHYKSGKRYDKVFTVELEG